jgi:hypothetical protein
MGVTWGFDIARRQREPAVRGLADAPSTKTIATMTHLKQNKQTSAFTKGAAAALLASCSWALPAVAADDAMTDLLNVLRQRGSISEAEFQRMQPNAAKQASAVSSALSKDSLKKDWFGKMSIRGYVQTRYTKVMNDTEGTDVGGAAPNLNNRLASPTEPNIAERESFFMRRARMIFSGDVHDHLYLYAQLDWQAGVNSGYSESLASGLQTRDMYGDISLDQDKEHRFRIGISKVPYGFVNLQSSQNRLSIERPEALNSAVEGERDLGVYYMWANKTARERFRDLVRLGLKGSGDYGVFTVGGYNGQGLNKYDSNRNLHTVMRMAYPFQLESGQYFELGLGGYQGKFVVAPSAAKNAEQFTDRRVAANFVWYPQPFGMEAEWTYGEGPESIIDYDAEGRGRFRNLKTGTNRYANPLITTENLHGGYVLFNYKADTDYGTVIPFTRWSYFDGARKFVANAPSQNVNELDIGIEYQPWPCFEVSLVYSKSFVRTNTAANANTTIPAARNGGIAGNTGIYNLSKDVDRLTLQLQFNY